MRSRIALGVGAALALFGVAACSDSEGDDGAAPEVTEEGEAPEQPEMPEMPEPDLDGIPETVAEVNGEEITREDFVAAYEVQFQQLAMQAQMSGEEVDQDELKQQTVDTMVGNELLTQEADSRGYDVSQEDLDGALQEIAEASGLSSPEEFVSAMEEQGMSEDEVMTQVETQVQIDRLLAEEGGDAEPTEDELRELYDQLTAQQEQAGGEGQDVPGFDEVRPQLEQQLESQREAETAQALVTDLRESGDVTIHL